MKALRQEQAPLFEELLRYAGHPLAPFHTPGHKQGRGMETHWQSGILSRIDLTEISTFAWEETLEQAEILAAQFYGADRSFFLVQGASQGIIGGILGVFSPGDTVLVARNCHISVIKGIILADLNPVFLKVDYLPGWNLPVGVNLASLELALQQYPEAKGLIVTNPTYQGVASNLEILRKNIGERLLFVDEAHGGHLSWCGLKGFDAYPQADVWIQGTHKLLGSLTQTGILHIHEKRIHPGKFRRGLDLITTTSPSYILLASLDSNRRFLATRGRRLFQEQSPTNQRLKQQIFAKNRALILNDTLVSDPHKAVDPWKLSLSFNTYGMTGYEAERMMQASFHIQPEYADLHHVTLLMAPWQDQADIQGLLGAIDDLCCRDKVSHPDEVQEMIDNLPEQVLRPRQALECPTEAVHINQAIGRVAAAVIAPYPPGIPLLVPGELIREMDVEYIKNILQQGGIVQGITPAGTLLAIG